MKLQGPSILLFLALIAAVLVSMTTARRGSRKGKKKDDAEPPSWKPRSNPAEGQNELMRKAGGKITLKCPADGNPKPKIKWSLDGEAIQKPKSGRIKEKKYNLIISDLDVKDSGNYTCNVFNKHGNIQWVYSLNVINVIWPLEVEGPSNVTAPVGSEVVFTCKVLNDPSAHIQWLKKTQGHEQLNKTITISDEKQMFINTDGNPERLVIQNIQMNDAGLYKCLVGNYHGLKYSDAYLTVTPERKKPKVTEMPKKMMTTTTSTTETTTLRPTTTTTMSTIDMAKNTTTMMMMKTKPTRKPPLTYTVPTTTESKRKGSKDRKTDNDRPRNRRPKQGNRDKGEGSRGKGNKRKQTPSYTMLMTEAPKTRPPKTIDISKNEHPIYSKPEEPKVYNSIPMDKETHSVDKASNEDALQNDDKSTEVSSIDLWKVYIIVGAIAGGILLIGLVTLVVAVICGRREEPPKSSRV